MYCTPDQVKSKLPQYTAAQWGTGHLPDDSTIEEIITEQDNLIDSYLGARYTLPFDPVPDLVIAMSRDLAACEIRDRAHVISPTPDKVVDATRREIIRRLEAMAKGDPPYLDTPTLSATDGVAGPPMAETAPDPMFTRDQVF